MTKRNNAEQAQNGELKQYNGKNLSIMIEPLKKEIDTNSPLLLPRFQNTLEPHQENKLIKFQI